MSKRPQGSSFGRLAASLLVPAALLAVGCGKAGPAAGPPPPVPVRVATAVSRSLPAVIEEPGTVEADVSATVVPRVDGVVVARHFAEGQEVAKGALLFTIDEAPFRQRLRAAEAVLARDHAQLGFKAAEAARYEALASQRAVDRNTAEQVRAEADALKATVASDEAAVEEARLDLSWCQVRAPIPGRAGAYLANLGTSVEAYTTPLVVVNRMRPVKVAFPIPETLLGAVRAASRSGGGRVSCALPGSAAPARGSLVMIDNAVDLATGTVKLKALLQNEAGLLLPGQFVTVTLELTGERPAVVVPSAAVETGPKGPYVFVVAKDSSVELRPVTVERLLGAECVLGSGVAAGETVVVEGQNKLKPGAKVTPAPTPEAGT